MRGSRSTAASFSLPFFPPQILGPGLGGVGPLSPRAIKSTWLEVDVPQREDNHGSGRGGAGQVRDHNLIRRIEVSRRERDRSHGAVRLSVECVGTKGSN